ncbi:hypothetical protein G6F56_012807 [Rhizopus delemar]|nr:hypothetical protein G6F56_012807 [Rhizopus delemar]
MLAQNKEQIAQATLALNDVKKLTVSHATQIDRIKGKESTDSSPRSKKLIPSKEIPKFNVNPTASALYQLTQKESNKTSSVGSSDPSLDMFLRDFERILLDHDVDVDQEWLRYLEVSFEKSDNHSDHDWFCRFLKRPASADKKDLNWKDAKDLLKQKFDLASQTTPEMWLKSLNNFKQEPSESLSDAMDRFRLFSLGAKVNVVDNTFLIYHFISKLHTVKFQEMVFATVKSHLSPTLSSSSNTTGQSIFSSHNMPIGLPKSWDEFETIL